MRVTLWNVRRRARSALHLLSESETAMLFTHQLVQGEPCGGEKGYPSSKKLTAQADAAASVFAPDDLSNWLYSKYNHAIISQEPFQMDPASTWVSWDFLGSLQSLDRVEVLEVVRR